MLPGVDAGMGVAGLEPAGDVGRKRRLAAEVQAAVKDAFGVDLVPEPVYL